MYAVGADEQRPADLLEPRSVRPIVHPFQRRQDAARLRIGRPTDELAPEGDIEPLGHASSQPIVVDPKAARPGLKRRGRLERPARQRIDDPPVRARPAERRIDSRERAQVGHVDPEQRRER